MDRSSVQSRVAKGFHGTLLRRTDCQLQSRESYKREEGKRPFPRGYRRGQKGETFHRHLLAQEPSSEQLTMSKDWSQGKRIF